MSELIYNLQYFAKLFTAMLRKSFPSHLRGFFQWEEYVKNCTGMFLYYFLHANFTVKTSPVSHRCYPAFFFLHQANNQRRFQTRKGLNKGNSKCSPVLFYYPIAKIMDLTGVDRKNWRKGNKGHRGQPFERLLDKICHFPPKTCKSYINILFIPPKFWENFWMVARTNNTNINERQWQNTNKLKGYLTLH